MTSTPLHLGSRGLYRNPKKRDESPRNDNFHGIGGLGRPTISTATDAAIRKALKKGDVGIRKIATTLGVGTGTVQRIKAEMSV